MPQYLYRTPLQWNFCCFRNISSWFHIAAAQRARFDFREDRLGKKGHSIRGKKSSLIDPEKTFAHPPASSQPWTHCWIYFGFTIQDTNSHSFLIDRPYVLSDPPICDLQSPSLEGACGFLYSTQRTRRVWSWEAVLYVRREVISYRELVFFSPPPPLSPGHFNHLESGSVENRRTSPTKNLSLAFRRNQLFSPILNISSASAKRREPLKEMQQSTVDMGKTGFEFVFPPNPANEREKWKWEAAISVSWVWEIAQRRCLVGNLLLRLLLFLFFLQLCLTFCSKAERGWSGGKTPFLLFYLGGGWVPSLLRNLENTSQVPIRKRYFC